MSPLPAPPQLPNPQMGPQGSQQVVNSPSWMGPQAIAEGLRNFATNYMLAQREAQQEAGKRVETSLRLASMGIPIDDKQLAKDIKKSKIPIALDLPHKPSRSPRSGRTVYGGANASCAADTC